MPRWRTDDGSVFSMTNDEQQINTFKARKIEHRGVTLPPPKQELFDAMGVVMESAFKTNLLLNIDIDPALLNKESHGYMREAWSVVARTSYKYLALAAGAKVEDI